MTVYNGGMQAPLLRQPADHPEDVMARAIDMIDAQGCAALVIVMTTEGGGVRAPGAMMAVDLEGGSFGYVSGGCIDKDIILRAETVIKSGEPQTLRYGAGSPFIDIRLPCGGAIDLLVLPLTDAGVLRQARNRLASREAITLTFSEAGIQLAEASVQAEGAFTYRPKLRLRIAGAGEGPVALTALARSAGLSASIWSPDETVVVTAFAAGAHSAHILHTSTALLPATDDEDTAFILMFHDHDWEPALLEQALSGEAFYIGAVGSRRTHELRCEALRARGVADADISRIHGPIGLVPSMRDASMLALSILAEIVDEYHKQVTA